MRDGGDLDVVPGLGPPGQTSFEEFYAAHFQSLTIQLYAYTRDLPGAQDVVQEAFCRALSRWKHVVDYDDPAAWVRRVAWNLATSRWRRTRTAAQFLRQQRPEHVAEPSPDRVALARALAALKPDHRKALILHYLADLPIAEIARQEGISENTVKSWLHRGRAALATQLSEEEADSA
ncbi:RNA polymerase sigma24 factor [Asanoa ishikariensis]|uniref:RNA polymerase sigma factor n=1 Tax=Asanoa ishikariensis TaxID=137265 RepID=UPI0015A28EAA|nr:SigE family RNA polymerase sigma factor [Asanoa ishikariensis]GIF65600.1 RNA polymerase sigma24 factor [Asanoa ishikariensis]